MSKVVTVAIKQTAFFCSGLICLQLFILSTQAESLGQVRLSWAANSEPDIAGYIVYFGTSSKNYTERTVLENITEVSVSDLLERETYYFAISAYNYFGLESELSEEIVYTIPAADDLVYTVQQGVALDLDLSQAAGLSALSSFFILDSPKDGTLSKSGFLRSYSPSPGFLGADQFQYMAFDGTQWSNRIMVTVFVVPPPPGPPVAISKFIETTANRDAPITLQGFDPGNLAIKYVILSAPQFGSLLGAAPNLTYRPHQGFTGRDSFTFRVKNGFQQSETATIFIDVLLNGPLNLTQINDPILSGALQNSDTGPVDELVALADLTNAINTANAIDSSLDPKSDASFNALESLVELDFVSACLSLDKLVFHSADQAGSLIAEAEADELIEMSFAIQELLGCDALLEQ